MAKNILIGALVVVVIALAAVVLIPKGQNDTVLSVQYSPSPEVSPVSNTSSLTLERTIKTYTDKNYGYSFDYPSDFAITTLPNSSPFYNRGRSSYQTNVILSKGAGTIQITVIFAGDYRFYGVDSCNCSFSNDMFESRPEWCPITREDYRIGKSIGGSDIYEVTFGDAGSFSKSYLIQFSPAAWSDYVISFRSGRNEEPEKQMAEEQEVMDEMLNIVKTFRYKTTPYEG